MSKIRKPGRPKRSDNQPQRKVISFRLRDEVVRELEKLTDMFNKRTGLSFTRSAILEVLIMNETKTILREIDTLSPRRDEEVPS